MALQRIDKLIAEQTGISRGDAKKRIAAGRVLVNGVIVCRPEHKADPVLESIAVDGRPLLYREHLYIMLNKPEGVVSATRDASQTTVLDLVPKALARKGLFPAGRLDKDTVGFVLLTDDGALAHNMLSPKHHVPKTYLATLDALPDEQGLGSLERGVTLSDGTVCRPARVRVAPEHGPAVVEIIITEGMYHQIKRMLAAVGRQVLRLERVAIGALALDPALAPGECKEIFNKDVEKLLTHEIQKNG